MLFPALEERLRAAKTALDGAASDSIIELCKQYLGLLAAYRAELYTLPEKLKPGCRSGSSAVGEDLGGARKEILAAIERITKERNRTEALLLSFIAVSGYEAAETFNREKYKGQETWELRAGGVGCVDNPGTRMSVQEAVETASLLRREAHVAKNRNTGGRSGTGLHSG
jgi:hypothetical protein